MQVIIYGKDNCPNCDRSEMLCRIKSVAFRHRRIGADISIEDLVQRVGHAVATLPQIFIEENGTSRYVGDYQALRGMLSEPSVAKTALAAHAQTGAAACVDAAG